MSYCAAGEKWVSRLEIPCIPTWLVGERWMERRSSVGCMLVRIGRLSAGVGRRHPVTAGKALLMSGSLRQEWELRHQKGAQYSAVEFTRTKVAVRNVVASAPQAEPASRLENGNAWCQFFAKWLEVLVLRVCPLQHYSEVCGLGAKA